MRENFTVLVQGPLEQNTIKAIECYSMDYKVVVSTWQEETELHEHVQHLCKLNNNIKFVNEKAPTVIGPPGLAGVLRDTTFHYAIAGLQNGLKFVDTEYVIRTRSDEFFDSLDYLANLSLQNTEKLVFGNIFARKWSDVKYHIGDHIYASKTHILKSAIDKLYKIQIKETPFEDWAEQGPYAAEIVLAHAFLAAKNSNQAFWHDLNTFKNNFLVFDINNFNDYRVRHGHASKTWIKNGSPFNNQRFNVKEMSDMIT